MSSTRKTPSRSAQKRPGAAEAAAAAAEAAEAAEAVAVAAAVAAAAVAAAAAAAAAASRGVLAASARRHFPIALTERVMTGFGRVPPGLPRLACGPPARRTGERSRNLPSPTFPHRHGRA